MNSQTVEEMRAVLEQACQALKGGIGERLGWEWDARMSSVLTTFGAKDRDEIQSWVQEAIPSCHDHQNIASAGEPVRNLANVWGGLRAQQLFFSLNPNDDLILFAAWWPWGNGQTISLRISCSAQSDEAKALDPLALMRSVFGV